MVNPARNSPNYDWRPVAILKTITLFSGEGRHSCRLIASEAGEKHGDILYRVARLNLHAMQRYGNLLASSEEERTVAAILSPCGCSASSLGAVFERCQRDRFLDCRQQYARFLSANGR